MVLAFFHDLHSNQRTPRSLYRIKPSFNPPWRKIVTIILEATIAGHTKIRPSGFVSEGLIFLLFTLTRSKF
jgi:hypothetical protein